MRDRIEFVVVDGRAPFDLEAKRFEPPCAKSLDRLEIALRARQPIRRRHERRFGAQTFDREPFRATIAPITLDAVAVRAADLGVSRGEERTFGALERDDLGSRVRARDPLAIARDLTHSEQWR